MTISDVLPIWLSPTIPTFTTTFFFFTLIPPADPGAATVVLGDVAAAAPAGVDDVDDDDAGDDEVGSSLSSINRLADDTPSDDNDANADGVDAPDVADDVVADVDDMKWRLLGLPLLLAGDDVERGSLLSFNDGAAATGPAVEEDDDVDDDTDVPFGSVDDDIDAILCWGWCDGDGVRQR